jgi:cadmium resistance transport/sequestration family protein
MMFFSQINNDMKIHHIVFGQYLGIVALTIISIIGALGVSIIPHEYVGLLGFVPIYLGIVEYVDHKKETKSNKKIGQGELQNSENSKLEKTIEIQGNFIVTFINPSVVKVAIVTFANGGDNIGIYIPVFTSMSLVGIVVTVIIFMILIAFWCFVGLKLVMNPFVQKNIEKYKHIFIPIIFIGLGTFILMESGTITSIYPKVF